ncbi:hypothetical protein QTP88_012246 [Uroleucon formosanum]
MVFKIVNTMISYFPVDYFKIFFFINLLQNSTNKSRSKLAKLVQALLSYALTNTFCDSFLYYRQPIFYLYPNRLWSLDSKRIDLSVLSIIKSAKDHTANFKGCPAFQSIFKKSAQKFQPTLSSLILSQILIETILRPNISITINDYIILLI